MEIRENIGVGTNIRINKIVLILGVGGIGSIVLIDLLRVGVKKAIIVDYDKVEIHNVNRQLAYSL